MSLSFGTMSRDCRLTGSVCQSEFRDYAEPLQGTLPQLHPAANPVLEAAKVQRARSRTMPVPISALLTRQEPPRAPPQTELRLRLARREDEETSVCLPG